jgi:hypothetical protein
LAVIAGQEVPKTTAEWLDSLRLGRYAEAFHLAGFDDIATLSHLNSEDLEHISAVSPYPILAGHRKQLLLEAPRLRGAWKQQRMKPPSSPGGRPSIEVAVEAVSIPRVLGPLQIEVRTHLHRDTEGLFAFQQILLTSGHSSDRASCR